MSSIIEDLIARKVFNSRGEETIEVDVMTTSGFGRASAPAGKSRGKAEVVYYPQGGVDQALKKVDEIIAPELAGLNADFQEEIDSTLHEVDGTTNFRIIGGNTAFAISLANAEAAANSHGMLMFQFLGGSKANTLPYPLGNSHKRGTARPRQGAGHSRISCASARCGDVSGSGDGERADSQENRGCAEEEERDVQWWKK